VKKAIILASIIALATSLFSLAACGRNDAGVENPHTSEECAGYETKILLATEESLEYESESIEDNGSATPITAQILLNGTQISLPGYAIYGQHYFRIDDIAYMLRDTLARFTFSYRALFHWGGPVFINRRYPGFNRRDDRPSSEGEWYRTHVGVSESVPVRGGGTTPRDIIAPIETFITESHPYFTLEALSGFLGFTIEHTSYGAILIDTSEPNISEYGRRVAEDFLSSRPYLFPCPLGSRVATAGSFLFYDIILNGIPDIFIQYKEQPDVYAVYVYFAEDESYLL